MKKNGKNKTLNKSTHEKGIAGKTPALKTRVSELEKIDCSVLDMKEIGQQELEIEALPSESINASVKLLYNLAHIKKLRGDMDGSKKLYNQMGSLAKKNPLNSSQRQIIDGYLTMLSISFDPGVNLLLSLAVLANDYKSHVNEIPRFSVTGNRPSVLSGSKDLSSMGKYMKATASMITPVLLELGYDAENICNVGVAEVMYEQNNLSGATLKLVPAMNSTSPQIAFAAIGLMSRIAMVDTTGKEPESYFEQIEKMISSKQAEYLRCNYQALKIRSEIAVGNLSNIKTWVETCQLNELADLGDVYHYGLITKAKAYIATGEYHSALTLFEQLSMEMEKNQRVLDHIDCLVGSAVVCHIMGNQSLASQKITAALEIGREYQYVRVFADYGKPLFQIMDIFSKTPQGEIESTYINKILEAGRIYATLYPLLYSEKGTKGKIELEVPPLTDTELHILQLIDDGLVDKDICAKLNIQQTTVRFHIKNIFDKLDATNRTQAIKKARDMGILL